MKRLVHNLAFLIFCIHIGCFGNPVRESTKDYVWIYDYTGQIETTTTACNESLARWSMSGDLCLSYHEGYMVAKLNNVKTSLFNGPRNKLKHVHEKEIPEESKVLQQPFVIKKADDNNLRILLKPNEPLWSINMKKAIASQMHFNVDVDAVEPNEKIEKPFEEESTYGKCKVHYTIEKLETITTYKKLSYWFCTDRAIHQETTSLKPLLGSINMFDNLDIKTENHLIMNDSREAMWKGSSKTKMTYKIMPSSLYSLNIIQEQTFTLRESVKAEEPIDISKFTDERNLIYEIGNEPTLGRHSYETDQSELAKQYMENYDIFIKNYENPTLENFDPRNVDAVDKMFTILMIMDKQGLKNIEKSIHDRNEFYFYNFHFALMTHIGTNATVKYLSKLLQTIPTTLGDSLPLCRFFATFPVNIRHPTDDILEGLEPFMDLQNMKQPTVKNAAVLSFASAVGRACRKDTISKKYIEKYVEIYNNKYLSGESSEERMTHLLGLINMAECLDADFINTIVTNTTELSAFRALAVTGFKPYLRLELRSGGFEVYWPVIQNKSEPFDVRVAALDLLLIAYPRSEQLDLIVDTYSKHFNDPEDKQLANYLLTSLHSLQNTNWYINNYIGAQATEYIKNSTISSYPKTWATGYYRLSYTDNEQNMGAYFDIRLITDPKTNMLNTIQLSFNHFVSSFDFGTYTLYLKVDGLLDWNCALQYINSIKESSIPELLKALKENKFEMKGISKNFRSDIILFVDNVAVYAQILENYDQDEFNNIVNELDFVASPDYISYPIKDYTHIPSALGTPIQISTYVQDISKGTFTPKRIEYRSSWYFQTWMEAYSPLVDTNIASYKYYVNEKNFDFNFKANKSIFTWENKDDSYTEFWDNMMGTAVEEEETLKEYCQECDSFNELPTDIQAGGTKAFEAFGLEILVTKYSHKEINHPTLSEFYHNIQQVNVDALPFAASSLLLIHREAHIFWLNSDLQRGSHRSYSLGGPNTTAQTTFSLKSFKKSTFIGIQAEINTTNLANNEFINYAHLNYKCTWIPITKNEEGIRESIFPIMQSDKFSLKHLTASANTTLIYAKNEDCDPEIVYVLSEVYTAYDKEKILEDENMKKDYDKCVSDSKDLQFTAPTVECKRISARFTEFDDFKVYVKTVEYLEDGQNITEDYKLPWFQYSRDGKNKLEFALLKHPMAPPPAGLIYYNHTIHYPSGKTINPTKLVFNDEDTAIPRLATSRCTISPSEVEQFSGKYIPNQKKEWLAFAECYNASTAGLTGHTIDDKHVGFKFYSDEHVVIATVKDGKAEIKINGIVQNEVKEPLVQLKVEQLAENVYHITNELVVIYYNTEYISVKVPSRYSNLLCGICTQEH